MQFYADTLSLPPSTFTILRDLIHERTGLFYEDSKRDILANKLSPRAIERGFDSFLDYYYLLKYDHTAADEWQQLVDALSVQETFFWREIDAVHALVRVVLPQWQAAHGQQPLRIWSAACATGEEPLTIAMALEEAGWFGRLPIELYASDASPAAIAIARRGIYRKRSFRNLPPALQERYFTEAENGWQVSPALQARVRWATANITAPAEIAALATAPIIFCRNVFLYFSADAIRRTVHSFGERMASPGYLFIGVSESLLRITDMFELREIAGAFVYVKR
jgi:chemotaxis protein methyltransferase CheR